MARSASREIEDLHEKRKAPPSELLVDLEEVEYKAAHITVPLSYADELYALRANIHLVRGRLGATAPAATPA